jgi:hypothetical protein
MYQFMLLADYFQFYVQDESVEGDLAESWNEEAVARLLAVAPGTVGIGTVRNMEVSVSLEILTAEPPLELDPWDHIVDCSLVVASQHLVVAGCTDYFPDTARIPVHPATYRLRAFYAALGSLSEDGLSGDDRYHLQLWPAPAIDPVVVKQRAA